MKCLNERWTTFRHFSGDQFNIGNFGDQFNIGNWQTKDIESFSIKCPNLKVLIMGVNMNVSMQSWPMLAAPWTSLQDLQIHCRPNFGNIFEDIELHMTLPNLWKIVLTEDNHLDDPKQKREPSFLPDLEGCIQLKYALFMHGFYRFGDDILPGDELHVPLPPTLNTLNLRGSTFHEEFMNRPKYEDIKKLVPKLERLMH